MDNQKNNYYEILGVSQNATYGEIRKSYIALAKKYHPDTTLLPKDIANEKMAKINEAYTILSDSKARNLYDLTFNTNHTTAEEYKNENYSTDRPSSYETFCDSLNTINRYCFVFVEKINNEIKYKSGSETINLDICNKLFADFYEYVLKEVNDLKNSAFCTDNTFEYVGLVFYKFSIAYTWTSQYEQALHFADQSLNYIPPQSDSYELVKKNRDKIYSAISNHKYKEKFWNIINGIRVIIFIFAVCAGIYSCITEPSASKKEPVKSPRDTNIQKELTPQSDIKTGYVPNTNILNTTGYSTITIDNTQNNVPVYVRLWSVGNNPYPVRTFTISPNNSFTALSITPGTYEIRYKFLYKEKEASFGNKSEPFKLSEIHTNTGIEYDQFKLTLYKVRNGNTHTYQIPVDEI